MGFDFCFGPNANNLLLEEGIVMKSLKILVVEDTDYQREICCHQLRASGFANVAGKRNGVEAISYLENNPVDLIISDWSMPELGGLELLKKVKANPSLQNIPFIMFTVHDDEEKNREAMEAGAIDFLVKPASTDFLQERIAKIFEGS